MKHTKAHSTSNSWSKSGSDNNDPVPSSCLKFWLEDKVPNNTRHVIKTPIACPINKRFIKATPLKLSSSRSHTTSVKNLWHPFNENTSEYNDSPACNNHVPLNTIPEHNKNSAKKAVGLIDRYRQEAAQRRVNPPNHSYTASPRPLIPLPITEYSATNEIAAKTNTKLSWMRIWSKFSRKTIKTASIQKSKITSDLWMKANR